MYDPSKAVWLNPNLQYLFNAEIIEYDMQDAGFNLIKQFNLLPSDKIRELEQIPKGIERHIEVGKLQGKDPTFSKALTDKFTELRAMFIRFNNLHDTDILSVKKDAIYTIRECQKTQFGHIVFAKKHSYSSYIRLMDAKNMELYYDGQIDIKGMGDIAVNTHRLYLLQFLNRMFSMLESKDSASIKHYLRHFIMDYKLDKLPEEYYIEFNRKSNDIDKLYNYQYVLIPLIQIVLREI